jgi:hypothetical protein
MWRPDYSPEFFEENFPESYQEFVKVKNSPITDHALVERMMTEGRTWTYAVHMQCRRVNEPLVNPKDPGSQIYRQEIDIHFLLVALTRLRRAACLAAQVEGIKPQLDEHLRVFDEKVPPLMKLRNVAEHFDDYTKDKVHCKRDECHCKKVRRHQLQTWYMGKSEADGVVFSWLGESLSVNAADQAATTLYSSFERDAENYLGKGRH